MHQSARKSSDNNQAKIDDDCRMDSPYPSLLRVSQASNEGKEPTSPFPKHQSDTPTYFLGDDFDLQSLRKWWLEKSPNQENPNIENPS